MVIRTIIMRTHNSSQVPAAHLGSPDGAVDRDLLVPPDAEAPDRVAGFGEHGRLPGQRLQHL